MIDGETLTLSTSAVATVAATTPILLLLLLIAGHLCVCICMFVWSSFSADWASTGGTLVKTAHDYSCPLTRMRLLSRELGSAVPSRASLLILHTQTYVAFTYGHPLPLPATVSIRPSCAIGLVSNLSGHTIALSMTFTTENRYRASSSQSSSTNGSFLFRLPCELVNVSPSFLTPTTDTVGMCFKGKVYGLITSRRWALIMRGIR